MKTRKSFLDWAMALDPPNEFEISHAKFYDFRERDYLDEVLDRLLLANPEAEAHVRDFRNLENQRHRIISDNRPNEAVSIAQIGAATRFCAKADDGKRLSTFAIRPGLSNYLARSTFLWYGTMDKWPKEAHGQYLFVPSFLPLMPKELCLVDLNVLLLDIMDYTEVFRYTEFLDLVAEAIDLPLDQLDQILLRFVTHQVLYYRTMLPTN